MTGKCLDYGWGSFDNGYVEDRDTMETQKTQNALRLKRTRRVEITFSRYVGGSSTTWVESWGIWKLCEHISQNSDPEEIQVKCDRADIGMKKHF